MLCRQWSPDFDRCVLVNFHPDLGMGVTECYENWNVGGNVFGNCGHNSTSFLPCAARYICL